MRPAPLTRAHALAWLMAHAYTRNRLLAALAYPVALATTLTYTLRAAVYESDDRNGMVIVARWRLGLDLLILMSVIAVGVLGLFLLAAVLAFVHPLLGPATVAVIATGSATGAALLARGQETATPISKDTPTAGDRWQIAALAQRPGTRYSAMLLTRRVVDQVVPAGDVLVASAADDKLEQAYIRAGFTPLDRKRLYKIA